ncbi:3-deoxy-7-phosphoheptulonate synthase [Candidatus Leptofilum sp.]|uniref:3-deoxy-7-phosphoheptulonate synthase n=1 Tax=Candidatus Leptofilum sp. TaxID=3241576 RepID=UPI003B5BE7BC
MSTLPYIQTFAAVETAVATQPVPITSDFAIGRNDVVLMAGPCSVESYAQTRAAAEAVARVGGRVLRGGAFKPRTSPNSFQGLGQRGLEILRDVADEFGLLVITEALAVEHVPLVAHYADIIQLGSRNMQHYPLLWAVGELDKPVMLKRGFMSTIDEWLKAAEHISSRGNNKIMLCERGIRTFETATRNTLDTNGIALAKQLCPYPIIADPSHATGRADLVIPAARAALAAGADGLLVEFHPDPANALSDGQQSLPLGVLPQFVAEMRKITAVFNRNFT